MENSQRYGQQAETEYLVVSEEDRLEDVSLNGLSEEAEPNNSRIREFVSHYFCDVSLICIYTVIWFSALPFWLAVLYFKNKYFPSNQSSVVTYSIIRMTLSTLSTDIWVKQICKYAKRHPPSVPNGNFRESSLLSYEESEEISNKCGFSSKANSSHYPWAVSLLLHDQHRLGGTIISPYHILTVAHGFMKFQMGSGSSCLAAAYRSIDDLHQRVVVYGGQCIRGESDDHPNHPDCYKADVYKNKIRSVLLNGDFAAQQCQNGNDIAIIELEHSIKFNERVSPICLPSVRPTIQKTLMVSGWGRSDIFKESGPKIHEVPMMVDKFCRRPWSDKLPHEAADLLCATSMNPTDYNTPRICHGDSGSGMEQRDPKGRATLIAMTSFGTTGCPANMLGRFTRVDHYLKPICNYTGLCYSSLEATTL